MSGGRLPKRIVFGNLKGAGRKGRGGKEVLKVVRLRTERHPAFDIAGDWKSTAFRVVQRLGGGGGGCKRLVPVLRGDGTKIAFPGDLFDQLPGEMNLIRGKLVDHAGDHIVLSPEGVVFVPSPGTESSYPRPPQSLEHSLKAEVWVGTITEGGRRFIAA